MRYLVVSDAHGDRQILADLLAHYQATTDAQFYCGDSELPADDPLFQNYQAVLGNMDFDPDFPKTRSVALADDHIFLTHGHLYQVNFDLQTLQAAAKKQQANVVLFGHTHRATCVDTDNCLFVNPGSISQPRGPEMQYGGTYAVIDSQPDKFEVQYFDRDFQALSKYHFEFKRIN